LKARALLFGFFKKDRETSAYNANELRTIREGKAHVSLWREAAIPPASQFLFLPKAKISN